jgi:hypothetical protein
MQGTVHYRRYTYERADGSTYTIVSQFGQDYVRRYLTADVSDVLVMTVCDCHA